MVTFCEPPWPIMSHCKGGGFVDEAPSDEILSPKRMSVGDFCARTNPGKVNSFPQR